MISHNSLFETCVDRESTEQENLNNKRVGAGESPAGFVQEKALVSIT